LTAPIRLINLTLGYDRHPAVHHLDGEIAAGEATQKLGCSRVNRRVQSWRVERATLLEVSK